MRTQLATPDEDLLTRNAYNQVLTMHGTTMVFLVLVPLLAGLAVYLVPLMIGSRRMAFPRLDALSYWLTLFGGVILYLSFFANGGAARPAGPPTRRSRRCTPRATARTTGSSACTCSCSGRSRARSTSSRRSTSTARAG